MLQPPTPPSTASSALDAYKSAMDATQAGEDVADLGLLILDDDAGIRITTSGVPVLTLGVVFAWWGHLSLVLRCHLFEACEIVL